ncbi:hypothetical protein CRG98_012140 [Punica granatum]|uniref:Uncharacterized protein n=1 Tax=Punica granatum TaxID=22663 RepID=A0A2I0KIA5_PUNGR|nr:hypothetical protein CRG98_012140 [Punica granatum]
MQTQDMLSEADNFALVTCQLVHFGRNRHSRVNSAAVTRSGAQPSVRHRAHFRARVRAAPVTAREFLLPSPQASVRPPSPPHVLPCACMRTCAHDAPNVCPRIRALVTARPSARHRVTKRLPAHPTPPRAPDTVTARLVVHSKLSRVHYRPSKGSTESPDSLTLPLLFPRIPRLEKDLDRRSEHYPDPEKASKLSAKSPNEMAET